MPKYNWAATTKLTFLCIGESPSERSPHADLSILQVLQSQVPNWDGLSIHLEAAPVITSHRSGQNQQLREEERMKPLRSYILIENKGHFLLQQKVYYMRKLRVNSYRATLVPQLTVTEEALTVVYEGVPLLFIQIFQFVYVILALWLPFPYVDIRQNSLDYSDLDNKSRTIISWRFGWTPTNKPE